MAHSLTRSTFVRAAGACTAAAVVSAPELLFRRAPALAAGQTIRVGVLYSLSGTIAIIEKSLHDACLMAIDEINARGGVHGRKLEAVVKDPASDPNVFNEKAKELVEQDHVNLIMGCYTSASRKAVLPVVERENALLWYPTLYEGEECSHNVVYTGQVPNQQLENFIPYILKNHGKKLYLVGSNYIYPKVTNQAVKALVAKYGGTIVGEEYAPLGTSEFSTTINKIARAKPNAVFSDLVGDSVVAFYKQYRDAGINARDIPICSPITTEEEIQAMGPENAVGHLTSFDYFQSIATPENVAFVKNFKARYGADRVTNAVMHAAYFQTFLLAQAIAKANATDTAAVRKGALGQSFRSPEGLVTIDPRNQHTALYERIGRANDRGQFDIVYDSKRAIAPQPWFAPLYPHLTCDWTRGGTTKI
ncbi:MAG: urea ABC transporter substrate-binding protein [Vulcanimicrobiaceae bacterium]